MPSADDRPRLSRGMTVFVAVDAVLVALFLVVLLLALTGGLSSFTGSSSAASSSPQVTAAGTPTEGAPGPATTPQALESFASPSGNIACGMSAEGVRCTIASITFAPPEDASCTGTIGHEVMLDATGVQVPCVDGPAPAVAPGTTPALAYGSSSSVGGYTCTSATDGVTCVEDATGTGFRLARAEYVVLP